MSLPTYDRTAPKLSSNRPSLLMPKRPTSIASSPFSSSNVTTLDSSNGSDNLKKAKVHHAPSWQLKEDINSLPEIPIYHVPSNTFAIVKEKNPRLVADRIVDLVASMSSVGNYNQELSTATIHTIENVKLSIHLFRNRDSNILVEVLRVSGDVLQFHRATRAILATAQNKYLPTNANGTPRSYQSTHRPSVTVTPNRDEPATTLESRNDQLDVVSSTMEKIQTLLKKDRMDAFFLGMESLQLLLNRSSSKEETVVGASKAILFNGGRWQDVRDLVFGLVMDRTLQFEDESDSSNAENAEYDYKFRLALTIFGNALDAIGSTVKDDESDFEIEMDDMKGLLLALKNFLEEPPSLSDPNHVQSMYQSARCISFLIDLSPELRSAADDLGIIDVASNFLMGGPCRHQLLANVSERIVSALAQEQTKLF